MPRERDLVSLLETGASATPDKPLYSFLDRDLVCTGTLTYRHLFDEALVLACHLQRCGLNRTPVLLIQQQNREFVKSFWACLLAGAWPMPCARPRGQRWQQLSALAVQSGAAAIITSSALARFIPQQDSADTPVIVTDADVPAVTDVDVDAARRQWIRPSVGADDIAFIQYTSGSTSNPKGVVITHANVMNNLAIISRDFGCSGHDIGLSWLPLHHDMGLIGHVLQPAFAGIHNYFLSPVDFLANPSRWLEAISQYHVTISGGPAFAYGFCARQSAVADRKLQLSQWRLAYCGSDRISAEMLDQFAARYADAGFCQDAWFPCYGLAESTLYVCGVRGKSANGMADNYVCIGDLSGADATARVTIVDPDTRQQCPDGVVGEIWISSGSVSPGYYRQSILSRQSFNQTIEHEPARVSPAFVDCPDRQNSVGKALVGTKPSDYFRTGDLGFMYGNRLYFSGRLKNLIKVRGRSLHAEDIESLLQHETLDTDLQRCVALGLQIDGVDAFVILAEHRNRRTRTQSVENKQLERQLRNLVCDTFGVIPHQVLILPPATLPLTSSGKPVRSLCLDVYHQTMPAAPCGDADADDRGSEPDRQSVSSVMTRRREVAANV